MPDAMGVGEGGVPQGGGPAGGVPSPAGSDEAEQILAALEAGGGAPPGASGGMDPRLLQHPVVQQMAARLQETEAQQSDVQIARGLLQAGLPAVHVPEVVKLFGVIRDLKAERDQAVGMLQEVDKSDVVIRGKAEELEKKYGRYGVKASDLVLLKPPTAEAMETLAKGLALQGRRLKIHERAEKGADNFEAAKGQPGLSRAEYMDMSLPGSEIVRRGVNK